jgi:hypothetical protein
MGPKLGLVSAFAGLVAVAVFLLAPATGGATSGNGMGAFQINGFVCNLLDGNGAPLQVTSPTKNVYEPDGSWNLTCRAKGAPNDTGGSVTYNFANTGQFCFDVVFGLPTTDFSETVSSSGNVSLTCHFSP